MNNVKCSFIYGSLQRFEENNCLVTNDIDEADKVLCITCNGWSLLEERSYDRIKSLKDYHDKTIVVGCINDAHYDTRFDHNNLNNKFSAWAFGVDHKSRLHVLVQMVYHAAN